MIDVVIINPIRIDLVSRITLSRGVVMTITIQMKDGIYYDDWFPIDMFVPLIMEVFGCLH
jgi:hypothetical protein